VNGSTICVSDESTWCLAKDARTSVIHPKMLA
jgi:hypothetical protein